MNANNRLARQTANKLVSSCQEHMNAIMRKTIPLTIFALLLVSVSYTHLTLPTKPEV